MRAVFIGTTPLSLLTADILMRRGHEVVMIERDRERIDAVSQELACAFLQGDATRPLILGEADPPATDVLYCLTDNDQANIIASLVGKSLGFPRVITCINDPEYEHICTELGLTDTIVPTRTIGRDLADMFEGHDPLVISTMFRDEARAFSFVIRKEDAGALSGLELPRESRVVCLYRDDRFILPEAKTSLEAGDEVILITHRRNLEELAKRWSPGGQGSGEGSAL
jgi:trk system potassium uptake protein TrkA